MESECTQGQAMTLNIRLGTEYLEPRCNQTDAKATLVTIQKLIHPGPRFDLSHSERASVYVDPIKIFCHLIIPVLASLRKPSHEWKSKHNPQLLCSRADRQSEIMMGL
jgi:hypothetical protein